MLKRLTSIYVKSPLSSSLRVGLCAALWGAMSAAAPAAEVIDDFATTNNLYTFGGGISLSADDNVLSAERTAGNVDTGFDWRVNWFFSLDPADSQSQFQMSALGPINGGYFVLNALLFENDNYLGEFTLQGDINATGTFGYDIAALAAQLGLSNATQWFPRIRITPFDSSEAGFEFSSFGAVASAATTVNSGTLTIGTNTVLGSGSLGITNGAQVFFQESRTVTNNVTIGTGSSGILNASSGTTVSYTGEISHGAATLIFAGSGATHLVNASITGATGGSVLAVDSTTLTLGGQSTYNGSTFVYGGGTLNLGATNALPTNNVLVIGAGASVGTVNLQGFDQTVASLETGNSSAGNLLNLGSGTITIAGSASATFAGTVSGTGGLTRSGSGRLILTAGNTYTGVTEILAGTLELAAASDQALGGTQSVTIAAGATLLLAQSDQVNNSATVTLSGGTIQRASGVYEVFGDLNLTQSSFLDFGTGTAGAVAFGSYTPSALLTVNNFFEGNTLTFSSDLGGDIRNTSLFAFDNSFTTDWDGSTFTITAIPEASTLVVAAGLTALFLWPVVRRRIRPA